LIGCVDMTLTDCCLAFYVPENFSSLFVRGLR
jgi:hypothetical protein